MDSCLRRPKEPGAACGRCFAKPDPVLHKCLDREMPFVIFYNEG